MGLRKNSKRFTYIICTCSSLETVITINIYIYIYSTHRKMTTVYDAFENFLAIKHGK